MDWPCPDCGAFPFFVGAAPDVCPFCAEEEHPACPDCNGKTVEVRFGKMPRHKLCKRWREPGHLSEADWRGKVQSALLAALPPPVKGVR
jgi:hypothetical protein